MLGKNKHMPYRLFYLVLLLLAVNACSDYQHPNLHPRQVGWQPDRDLTPYLNTDSMIGTLEQVRGIKARLDSLLEWTDLLNYHHKKEALLYADEAYQLGITKGYRFSQAMAMYYRALIKSRMQILGEGMEDALADGIISKELLKPDDDQIWQVRIKGLLGLLYYKKDNEESSLIDSAFFYTQQSINQLASLDIPVKERAYLESQLKVGLARYKSSSSKEKISLFDNSIQLAQTAENYALTSSYLRVKGRYIFNKNNLKSADSILTQSLEYAYKSKDEENIVSSLQALADLKNSQFAEEHNPKYFFESLNYLNQCLKYTQVNLYYTYELFAYNYDEYLYKSGNPPKVYSTKGDTALYYYELALKEAQKEGVLDVMRRSVNNINYLCSHKERLTGKKCLSLSGYNYSEWLNNKYDLFILTMRQELTDANNRLRNFEIDQVQRTNNQRLKSNRFFFAFLITISLLVFLVFLQRIQQKKLKANMSALRAQMNPHFFSNSLNAIDHLINADKRKEASKYLIHFSRLSRRILSHSRQASTSLSAEIQTLEHFLALEKLRFKDKLNYDIQIEETLKTDEIEVPGLILQPYVENAIIHGIKPKNEPGNVTISIKKQGKFLQCIIEDDGIGRQHAMDIKRKLPVRKSYSMDINAERIRMTNNNKKTKLHIEDLQDLSGNPKGTRVTIKIKLKKFTPTHSFIKN